MISTQLQYRAVALRIGQLKEAEASREAAKELAVLKKLLKEFENRNPEPDKNNQKIS